jgi:pyruvate ferredoxin oxidoreductase beta subunit
MEKYQVYVPRLVQKEEKFTAGHRACIGCGEALAVRQSLKALDNNVIIVNATGCAEIFGGQFPATAWEIPWIHTLFENTAAVASGVESALKALRRKGGDIPAGTKVVAIGGDGGTADIGLQALSGALERGHDFTYICFDNEAYMNTGVQRSSSTPFGARTTTSPAGTKTAGQLTWKKNLPEIAVSHRIPYVATATHGYPFDLMAKVAKAVATPGPAYVHVLSVCPTGWGSATDTINRQARLAVETGVFPLYEVVDGKYKMSIEPAQLRPVTDYLKIQTRFRHLTPNTIEKIQKRVVEEYNIILERANAGKRK